jgi:hypothetical protein
MTRGGKRKRIPPQRPFKLPLLLATNNQWIRLGLELDIARDFACAFRRAAVQLGLADHSLADGELHDRPATAILNTGAIVAERAA